MDFSRFDLQKAVVIGLLLIILVLLATLTLYSSAYTVIFVTSIFMYIILTVSWVLFSGPTGYISLATAAFFGVGIYVAAIFGTKFPLPIIILIGALASFCFALLVGALTLRLKGIYFAMFTFGLVELIKHFLLWYEIKFTGTRGRFVILVDNNTIYNYMFLILVVLLIATYLIRRSKYGLALLSIGEFEDAASHIGVNVNWLKTFIFAVSAGFIGAAGSIMATRWTYVDPYIAFNFLYSFLPVLMATFGGMGQLYGPVLGAIIFSYLEELLITEFPYYYMLILGLILLVVILYLPDGLLGIIEKWRATRRGKQHVNP